MAMSTDSPRTAESMRSTTASRIAPSVSTCVRTISPPTSAVESFAGAEPRVHQRFVHRIEDEKLDVQTGFEALLDDIDLRIVTGFDVSSGP